MQLYFRGQYSMTPRDLIRRCGYGELMKKGVARGHLSFAGSHARSEKPASLMDRAKAAAGEVSYVRHIGSGDFPRFHAYIDMKSDGFQVNLHLDQKAPTYGEHTAHSGEYDGSVVEAEAERLRQSIEGQRHS